MAVGNPSLPMFKLVTCSSYSDFMYHSTLDELRKLLEHPKCVAVGETGLDFNRNFSPPDVQEVWFDKQVCIAPHS